MGEPGAVRESGAHAHKRRILAVLALGVFMATLDGSIVNLALPVMAHDFRVDPASVSPVVSAYLVAIAASLLLFGALGDRTGRRRLYLAGVALFTAGSGLCATAGSLEALVFFRILQAIGGSSMFALAAAILIQAYPANERGAALGWIAAAVAGGQTAGPVLGGLLLSFFGWPSIFLINVPIGVAAYIATGRVLSKEPHATRFHRADGTLSSFDMEGAVLLPAGLLLLMAALDLGALLGAFSPAVLVLAVGSVGAFVLLRAVERREEAPLIDLAVFRNRAFVAANTSAILSFISIGAVSFALPFYLRGVLHFEPYRMGLALLPIPLAIAFVGPVAGRLSDRIGSRTPCVVGLALATVSVLSLSALSPATSDLDLIWRLALFGAGMALFQSPNNSSAMGSVDRRLLGLASGMLSTMRTLGFALGVALCAILLGVFYAAHAGGLPLPPGDIAPDPLAFVEAQRLTFLVTAAITAAGIATSLVRPNRAG